LETMDYDNSVIKYWLFGGIYIWVKSW
jgi:hypothetical protein